MFILQRGELLYPKDYGRPKNWSLWTESHTSRLCRRAVIFVVLNLQCGGFLYPQGSMSPRETAGSCGENKTHRGYNRARLLGCVELKPGEFLYPAGSLS